MKAEDVKSFADRYYQAHPDERRAIREEFESAVLAIIQERDQAVKELKESDDQNDALHNKLNVLAPAGTCGCTYDRPEDVCMHHSPNLAQAIAERDALKTRVKMLEAAVTQIWPDIGSIGPAAIYCRFCPAKAEWIQVATGLEFPPLSAVEHAPDCIVAQIQSKSIPSLDEARRAVYADILMNGLKRLDQA